MSRETRQERKTLSNFLALLLASRLPSRLGPPCGGSQPSPPCSETGSHSLRWARSFAPGQEMALRSPCRGQQLKQPCGCRVLSSLSASVLEPGKWHQWESLPYWDLCKHAMSQSMWRAYYWVWRIASASWSLSSPLSSSLYRLNYLSRATSCGRSRWTLHHCSHPGTSIAGDFRSMKRSHIRLNTSPPPTSQWLRPLSLITSLKCFLVICNFAKWTESASPEREHIRE